MSLNWADSYYESLVQELGESFAVRMVRGIGDSVRVQRDLTLARVQRIAKTTQHLTYARKGEAGMIATLNIPELDYHGWAMKFADANGNPDYSCWKDPEFVREYKRDNPELRCHEGKRTNRIVSNFGAPKYKYEIVPRSERKAALIS
jgi:hypothetical protein